MAFAINMTGNNIFEVGAFDAKTYFAELLRKVQDGAVINISKNGKQVAVLQGKKTVQNTQALEAHERIMARSKKFVELKNQNGREVLTAGKIKEYKNNGRKY
ncbi:MAG: type II toxin-antitoxin system prevent-host-death family antitoxin [Treponema sp.]|nr:type II toxin-antitoxin system prevent-host-death family antitoxin [Treponema sp.]